jgi:hypothetical protein
LELSERLQVGIHPVLLTPLPGTELYDEYREHLIPGLGWDSFTGVRSVFEHPSAEMTPMRREQEYHKLSHELFRFERIANRIGKISSGGFPSSHIYSFMMQVPMKHALSKAYEEWKSSTGVVETVPATSAPVDHLPAEGCVNNNENVYAWLWAAIISVLAIVEVIQAFYYDSAFIDILQVILFITSILVIMGHLYLNRIGICRNMDVLIDWSRDGRARKRLMIRQLIYGGTLAAGQYVGFFCVMNN